MTALPVDPADDAVEVARTPDRKELLLAAGVALYDEVPFDGVTVDAVAERAGVARGLVAYYFGTKQGLYRAVSEQFGLTVRARLLDNPSDDPAAWLHADVTAFLSVVQDHPMAMRNTTSTTYTVRGRRTPMSAFTVVRVLDVLGATHEEPLLNMVIAGWGWHCLDLALRWIDEPEIARDDVAAVMVAALRSALAAVSQAHPELGLPTHPFT